VGVAEDSGAGADSGDLAVVVLVAAERAAVGS
jgi:hypothetical protein